VSAPLACRRPPGNCDDSSRPETAEPTQCRTGNNGPRHDAKERNTQGKAADSRRLQANLCETAPARPPISIYSREWDIFPKLGLSRVSRQAPIDVQSSRFKNPRAMPCSPSRHKRVGSGPSGPEVPEGGRERSLRPPVLVLRPRRARAAPPASALAFRDRCGCWLRCWIVAHRWISGRKTRRSLRASCLTMRRQS